MATAGNKGLRRFYKLISVLRVLNNEFSIFDLIKGDYSGRVEMSLALYCLLH